MSKQRNDMELCLDALDKLWTEDIIDEKEFNELSARVERRCKTCSNCIYYTNQMHPQYFSYHICDLIKDDAMMLYVRDDAKCSDHKARGAADGNE